MLSHWADSTSSSSCFVDDQLHLGRRGWFEDELGIACQSVGPVVDSFAIWLDNQLVEVSHSDSKVECKSQVAVAFAFYRRRPLIDLQTCTCSLLFSAHTPAVYSVYRQPPTLKRRSLRNSYGYATPSGICCRSCKKASRNRNTCNETCHERAMLTMQASEGGWRATNDVH